jgi:transposase-like protein/transposase Tn5 family protein
MKTAWKLVFSGMARGMQWRRIARYSEGGSSQLVFRDVEAGQRRAGLQRALWHVRKEAGAMVILETADWARETFGKCDLGDRRRTKRLIKLAEQAAARPDGSTPDQTESWADCKAAYRLFNEEDVTFEGIIAPHCAQTRAICRPGDVKLLINDTTEIDYGMNRTITGLGPTGNGKGQGFFLHSALMIDAADGRVDGLAGQLLFHRKRRSGRVAKNQCRRSANRESAVWGKLVDQVGAAPRDVKWVHVDDRGADDVEVFCRIRAQGNSCVIRASRLNRWVFNSNAERVRVKELLEDLPCRKTRELDVPATAKSAARTATLELRFAELQMPVSTRSLTPWLRKHLPQEPLRLSVVELRETDAPKGTTPLRWVLYTMECVTSIADAETVIGWYERRPTIEDYHKALKTGCHVERRYYETSARLERVTGLLSVVAVRLMQIKTAAHETPDRPACEVAPKQWIKLVQTARKKPEKPHMTIREFIRAIAGLGGHLGRKCDGEPGWITLWRGFEKLMLLERGADAHRNKCG